MYDNLLIGLMRASSTNLSKVARHMPGGIKFASKYRRLQRFFEKVNFRLGSTCGIYRETNFGQR